MVAILEALKKAVSVALELALIRTGKRETARGVKSRRNGDGIQGLSGYPYPGPSSTSDWSTGRPGTPCPRSDGVNSNLLQSENEATRGMVIRIGAQKCQPFLPSLAHRDCILYSDCSRLFLDFVASGHQGARSMTLEGAVSVYLDGPLLTVVDA